jgi:HAD superfamily hydrolase (TIGR01458 family)
MGGLLSPHYSWQMSGQSETPAILLDIDGVLYIGDEPIPGAVEALRELRELSLGIRLVTNTTSRSRAEILAHLHELGFEVDHSEVLTPAALAVRHCREQGHHRVRLLVADALLEDLQELAPASRTETIDAVVLGDLGEGFTAEVLNEAFRLLMEGAELVALQHNRFWRRKDGLVLDVGAYSAALEYASGREAVIVGKPSPTFFAAALADLGAGPQNAVMVGDDIEADVGGAIDAGLQGFLVRTGKFREDLLESSQVRPTEVLDSIADVGALLRAHG